MAENVILCLTSDCNVTLNYGSKNLGSVAIVNNSNETCCIDVFAPREFHYEIQAKTTVSRTFSGNLPFSKISKTRVSDGKSITEIEGIEWRVTLGV